MTGHVGRPFGTLKELNFAETTLRKCHSFGGNPQKFFYLPNVNSCSSPTNT